MLVYTIWWLNYNKQHWEGKGKHGKGKNAFASSVPTIFVRDCGLYRISTNLEVLWKTSLLFGILRPAWFGMMQFAHRGCHPGQSSVVFRLMIDMSSSTSTWIFCTLKFVSEHAWCHEVTPKNTFEKPLWWKVLMIIESEPANSNLRQVVFRLGSFHTEMGFIDSSVSGA